MAWQKYFTETGNSFGGLMANCLLIRASLVPLNTMNGGSFSLLRLTPKSTVQRPEVPEIFIPMVLAHSMFSNVNDPNKSRKIEDVCLINIDSAPRVHTKGLNLLIGICYKLKHSGLVESCVLSNMCHSPKNNTLFHHPSIDPL